MNADQPKLIQLQIGQEIALFSILVYINCNN